MLVLFEKNKGFFLAFEGFLIGGKGFDRVHYYNVVEFKELKLRYRESLCCVACGCMLDIFPKQESGVCVQGPSGQWNLSSFKHFMLTTHDQKSISRIRQLYHHTITSQDNAYSIF